ncbi:MAG: PAS domain S-box protein [Methanomicrobiaceae archaeon]|nr:PAS domain S-box protein [Methanomicrobiaceae archaeon]
MQPEHDPTMRLLNLLRFKARGMTITEISRATKMNRNSVAKYLQMLLATGQVAVENVGNAKMYSLSRRIPLSAILSYSSDLIAVIDQRGTIVQVNDPFIRCMDLNREHVLGAQFDDGTIPIFRNPVLLASIERGMEGEETTVDIAYEDVAGLADFHVKCIPTTLEGGEGGLSVFLEDITERKHTEHALVESEERFRRLAEHSPFPISIIDASGRYLFLSKMFVETFGYTLEDIPSGSAWFSRAYPDPDIRHAAIQTWKEDIAKSGVGMPRPRTFPVTCKDGNVRYILFRPITMQDGNQFIFYQDISQSHRLEEMQSLLAAIVESSEDAIIGIDLEGMIVSWNKGAVSLYGYSIDDVVGKPRSTLIPPEKHDEIGLVLERVKQGLSVDRFETRRRRKDGKIIDVSVTVSPIIDDHGVVRGASTISRNITERKRAERELKASHQKLLEIIDFLPDATFVTDTEGTVIAWNAAIEDLTGMKKEEILGKGRQEYAIPFYGTKRPCLLDLLFVPEEELTRHYSAVQREGDSLQCEVFSQHLFERRGAHLCVKACPLYDAEGSVVGAVESIRDITALKNVEEALENSREYYRTIVEDQTELIFRFGRDHTITFANRAFLDYFGVQLDAGRIMVIESFVQEEDAAAVQEAVGAITPDAPLVHIEIRAADPGSQRDPGESQEPRWQRWAVRGIFTGGDLPDGYQVVGTDISLEKKQEEAARHYLRDMAFLAETSMDFANMGADDDILEYIGQKIASLLPGHLSLYIGLFDPATDIGHIVYAHDIKWIGETFTEMTGKTLLDTQIMNSDEIREGLKTGIIFKISDNFSQFFRGSFPQEVCERLDSLQDRVDLYAIGLSPSGDSIGWCAFTLEKGAVDKKEKIIETFVKQAAIALEKQQAEQRLRWNEAKYRELVENANSIILKLDKSGRITFFNEFAQRFFGFSEDEMLGKHAVGTIVPETESSGRDLRRMIDEICADPDRFDYNENETITREGRRVWTQWTNRAIRDDEGDVTGVLCIGVDFTEKKQIEGDLKESELRFRRMAEYSPFPIVIIDPDDSIRYMNDRFTELFGYTPDIMGSLEEWLAAVFPDEKYRAWAGRIWREELRASLGYLNTGPIFSIRTLNGEQRSVIIHPVTLDDRSSFVTFQDITEKKRLHDKEQEYTRNLELLSKTAMDLAHLRSSGELYDYVCEQLGPLVPEALVVVFSCANRGTRVRIQSVSASREILDAIESAVDRPLQQVEIFLAKDAVQYLRLGRTHRVRGRAEGLLEALLPEAAASKVAATLGRGECYVRGFIKEEDLLGGIVVCLPEGAALQNENVISILANQASVALFRCHAEEHLVSAHRDLEKQLIEHSRALSNANEILNLESFERKYIMRSLKKQSALMFSLLDFLNIVIVGTDKQGRITLINERARALFQCTVADAAGTPWYDLLASASFRKEAQALHTRLFEGGTRGEILLRKLVTGQGEDIDLVLHLKGACDEQGVLTAMYLFGEEPPGRNVLLLSKYLAGELILLHS